MAYPAFVDYSTLHVFNEDVAKCMRHSCSMSPMLSLSLASAGSTRRGRSPTISISATRALSLGYAFVIGVAVFEPPPLRRSLGERAPGACSYRRRARVPAHAFVRVCVCLRASCGVTVLPVVLSMAQGLRQHPSFVVRKVCELSARACETGCRLTFPT